MWTQDSDLFSTRPRKVLHVFFTWILQFFDIPFGRIRPSYSNSTFRLPCERVNPSFGMTDMGRSFLVLLVALALAVSAGCAARRMSPFAPHRTDSDVHRNARNSQACVGCHEVADLSGDHKATDDCMKCHRILYGDL